MSKMKEHSNSFERDARNLAEATMRLCCEIDSLRVLIYDSVAPKTMTDLNRVTHDAEGEAQNILAKTLGA